MSELIDQHLDDIRALCRAYGVARLEVFGSVVTDAFDPERSDIDFLVSYPAGYEFGLWLERLQSLEAELARLLGAPVDLVLDSALDNRWFRREAAKTRRMIYDASAVTQVA